MELASTGHAGGGCPGARSPVVKLRGRELGRPIASPNHEHFARGKHGSRVTLPH